MYIVYKILNTTNGRSYIGSTSNYDKRLMQHKTNLDNNTHHNKGIQSDYIKYTESVFSHSIIFTFNNKADALKKESTLIKNCDNSYNVWNKGQTAQVIFRIERDLKQAFMKKYEMVSTAINISLSKKSA